MLRQLIFFLALALSSSALHLTSENWDAETAGKTIFIKFYAPWCSHCQELAPDWEKLTHEFDASSTQLVGEVDCDSEEELCNVHGIEGFPSLKYGDPSDMQDYEGERGFEDMLAFATENLKPMCGINNLDLCTESKRSEFERLLNMSVDDLRAMVEKEEQKIADAEEKFQAEVDKLQAQYEKMSEQLETAKKASGHKLIKSVLEKKKASDAKDEL